MRGCSVCARKRDKLYVGECMALAIGLSRMFSLCTFDSPFSLGGRGFKRFNVDFSFTGNVIFFHQDLSVLRDCISWIFVKLFCMLCSREGSSFS